MKKLTPTCFLIITLLFSAPTTAQNRELLDSLDHLISSTKIDTIKIQAMQSKAWKYRNTFPDSALTIIRQAHALALDASLKKEQAYTLNTWGVILRKKSRYQESVEKLLAAQKLYAEVDYQRGIASSLNNLGVSYRQMGEFSKALEQYTRALSIFKAMENERSMGLCYTNIGLIHYNKSNYNKAIEYYNQGLKLARKTNDNSNIGNTLNNLALVSKVQGNLEEAVHYFEQALDIFKKLNNRLGTSYSYHSLANIYKVQGDFASALDFHKKAIAIRKDMGNKNGLSSSYNDMGNAYYAKGDKEKALEYYTKALQVSEEIHNDRKIAAALGNIGLLYFENGDHTSALLHFERSLEVFRKIGDKTNEIETILNLGNLYEEKRQVDRSIAILVSGLETAEEIGFKDGIRRLSFNLSEIYKRQNDFEKALEYYQQYAAIQDSIFTRQSDQRLKQLKVEYALDEKQDSIHRLEAEKVFLDAQSKQDRFQKHLLAGILLILSLIAGLVFWNLNLKRKKNKAQQKLIEANLEMVQLEESRLKEALEYKEKQLTTKTLNLIQKNELINTMKDRLGQLHTKKELSKQDLLQLQRLLDHSINIDADWEEFKLHFEQVNQGFFYNLKNDFPDLTSGQLRLCALIRLNLNIKEAATILHLSPNSVRVARTRIRKKLTLQPSNNLEEFLLKY